MKKLFVILLALSFIAAPAVSAQTDQRKQLAREIEELDRQIAANSSKTASETTKLRLIQKKVEKSRALVQESNKEIARYNSSIKKVSNQIKQAQRQLDTALYYYERLIKTAYLNRDTRIWTLYVLSGKNLSQDIRRYNYLKSLGGTLQSQGAQIISKKKELESRKAELETLKAASAKVLKNRDAEYKQLQAEEKSAKQLIAKIKKNTTKYKKELAQKQKQLDALDAKVKGLVSGKGKKVYSEAEKKLSGEFSSNKGKLPWPVDGVVVQPFGEHAHPVLKNVKVKSKGVDIATAADAKVYCIFQGVVSNVVVMPGYNQCVLVQHGQYYSFYCGLKNVKVKAGSKVTGGAVLGNVDTINGNTALHFQIWNGTAVQDPQRWLSL